MQVPAVGTENNGTIGYRLHLFAHDNNIDDTRWMM